MAQAESDAMQYTLPLKQKQIEQSRLEAEARKQTTIGRCGRGGIGAREERGGGSAGQSD